MSPLVPKASTATSTRQETNTNSEGRSHRQLLLGIRRFQGNPTLYLPQCPVYREIQNRKWNSSVERRTTCFVEQGPGHQGSDCEKEGTNAVVTDNTRPRRPYYTSQTPMTSNIASSTAFEIFAVLSMIWTAFILLINEHSRNIEQASKNVLLASDLCVL